MVKRSVAKVKEDIDRWLRIYPAVQGIFLDGQATSPAQVDYCAEVYEYAHRTQSSFDNRESGHCLRLGILLATRLGCRLLI